MATSNSGKKKTTTGAKSTSKRTGGTSSSRRKTVRSKGTVRKSGSRKSGTKQSSGTSDMMLEEIVVCILFAFAILMLISNFGAGGRIGNAFADIMFGVFGLMQYIFPFVILFGTIFYIANRRETLIIRKMIGMLGLFVFSSAFIHLLTVGYSRGQSLRSVYRICSVEHTGGGVVGGSIVFVFAMGFGVIGAYVLTVAGIMISTIIMTQKPLMKSLASNAVHSLRMAWERYQIRQELRELERAALNEEQRKEIEKLRNSYPEELHLQKEMGKERKAQKAQNTEDGQHSVMDVLLNRVRLDADSPADSEVAFTPDLEEVQNSTFDPSQITIDGDGVIEEADATQSLVPDTPLEASPLPFPSFLKRHNDAAASAEPNEAGSEADNDVTDEEVPDLPSELNGSREAEQEKQQKLPKSTPIEKQEAIEGVQKEITRREQPKQEYILPSVELLTKGKNSRSDSRQTLMDTAQKLQGVLADFGVNVKVVNVSCGPTVTRYELQPEQGVKVSKIVNLQDDIKLNLAASEIRIEAPIPGKAAVGIEVPNRDPAMVLLRDLLESPEFQKSKATIPFAVGKDIAGKPVIADIEKMPHLLIAGATGSGKSVCINTLIMSILYKNSPDDVKMLMIDPKVVEMKIYDGIPHLLIPVVTDAKKAAGALNWAVQEMTERYNLFASHPGIRDIKGYNHFVKEHNENLKEDEAPLEKMPRIVIIVDELADLMMVASGEVEDAICRLAQLARAAGIHLIIATQRPSVNVVTGLIKANMPSRIALSVTSGVDSRTILDMNGAEKLLGHGDMLFYPQNYPKPARIQGDFVSDEDITSVVEFLTSQGEGAVYNEAVEEKIMNATAASPQASDSAPAESRDEYFYEAGKLIIEKEKASIGMLQRAFKIGFNRAARIMDQLAEAGAVGPEEGTKPRKILMTMSEFEQIQ